MSGLGWAGPGVLLLALVAACRAGSLHALITTPAGVPVESAVLSLEPVSGTAPARASRVSIKQRDREFLPYVSVVPAGSMVEFPNLDPLKHHVYSFSPAKTFEIKLYAGTPSQPVLFDKLGVVALGCNIHDWMEAYVLVVNTPYFAKTTSNGRAVINAVPAGRYKLHMWHPRQKGAAVDSELELGSGKQAVNLVLDVARRVPKPKPPMDAEPY